MKSTPHPVAEGEKHCFTCGTTKPESEFYRALRKDRPSQRLNSRCKACHRAYYSTPERKAEFIRLQREARARKRARLLSVKTSQGCADCGESHPACLDFHHLDPSQKEHNVVRLVDSNAGWNRIEGEAAKCVVLCANCHRKRHFNEREATKAIAKEA